MDCAKTGKIIYQLRRERGLTQLQLAQMMNISDKAVSKWERGLGCPDVSVLPELSDIFGVNIEQMLSGELTPNEIVGGNMKKSKYYVCPECGSISICTGESEITCCGRRVSPLTPVKPDESHSLAIERSDNEWFITSSHPMTKEHYISFVAFATGDRLEVIKQYPEWNIQTRLYVRDHGTLIWYCIKDGLFYKHI